MTKPESRMKPKIRMTNRHLDLVIDSSFWFRHSSFNSRTDDVIAFPFHIPQRIARVDNQL
jgi:hypothetical protein